MQYELILHVQTFIKHINYIPQQKKPTINSAVGTIRSSAYFCSTLYLNVFDYKMICIQSFVLSITFGIPRSKSDYE